MPKLFFPGGMGGVQSSSGNSGGVGGGGILVVKNWKFWGGGGAYVKFPPWWGYGYFLELHDRNYNFRSCYDSFKTIKEEF